MDKSDIQAAIDAGVALAEPQVISDTPILLVPLGASVKNLEHLLDEPTRRRGQTTLRDEASFIKYVLEENESPAGGARIYGSYNPPQFIAVLNDHHKLNAGWRDFTAKFNCPLSIEWQAWLASSKKTMTQTDFAQFIEDNLPDIVEPAAADMLEISRSLEAKKKVNFASGIRLANGENQLTYEEEISGTAQKGQLQVPEVFAIGIPVLEGGPRYRVEARLRYRIADGGKLSMWYELVRPHKVLEDAVKEVWQLIQTETNITILNGSPD